MLNCSQEIDYSLPDPRECETSLFGPGVGECIVVHLGNGQWMIVDSCLDPESKKPVALKYLNKLGVDCSKSVQIILITHWHDDHIRGISEIVEACPVANVCYSAALLQKEFLGLISTFSGKNYLLDRDTSGTKEIAKVVEILKDRLEQKIEYKSCLVPVTTECSLFTCKDKGHECEVTALSPSHKSVADALVSCLSLIPHPGDFRKILSSSNPNHNAVVLWIRFGEYCVLLGSDLEETTDPRAGWKAIVESGYKPIGKANLFKIPHHGSINAHSEEVWTQMVNGKSVCLLTPYSRGKNSPPQGVDLKRIKQYTSRLFFTAEPKAKVPKRDHAVERTLRGMASNRKVLGGKIGQVQVRVNFDGGGETKVNVSSPALRL